MSRRSILPGSNLHLVSWEARPSPSAVCSQRKLPGHDSDYCAYSIGLKAPPLDKIAMAAGCKSWMLSGPQRGTNQIGNLMQYLFGYMRWNEERMRKIKHRNENKQRGRGLSESRLQSRFWYSYFNFSSYLLPAPWLFNSQQFFPLPSIFFNSLPCLPKGVGDGFLILATREFPSYTLKCITFKVSIVCVLEMPWLPHENSLCTRELKESLFSSAPLAGAKAQGRADLE